MINHTVVYAMACLMYLSGRRGRNVQLAEIAAAQGIPQAYCQKVLAALARAGILQSFRGQGYCLERDAKEISLRQVMEALSAVTHPRLEKEEGGLAGLTERLGETLAARLEGVLVSDFVA